ncbi:MAG: hypothetical protein M1461_10335 [Nitrospirae bacterium]|nr:hypothetical protein [Nitrospirota bacterium]
MPDTKDHTDGTENPPDEVKAEEDTKLEAAAVLRDLAKDLEPLRPLVSDKDAFDELIEAVRVSTQRSESIDELRQRIIGLGDGAVNVAEEILGIIT